MTPSFDYDGVQIYCGNALSVLQELPSDSVSCCVTSPPYWGLRDYQTGRWEGGDSQCDHKYNHGKQGASGQRADRTFTAEGFYKDRCGKCGATRVDEQLGLEKTPQEYVSKIVSVFREVRRTMRDDATLWLNIGDSFANDTKWGGSTGGKHASGLHDTVVGRTKRETGLKAKDLVGIPWRLAFALQEDAWWLRSDIIWAKPAPMPESVTDRPTRSHEYVFLLTKSERYYYDHEAIKEPTVCGHPSGNGYKRDSRLSYKDERGGRRSDQEWKPRPSAPKGSFQGKTEAMSDTGQNAFRAVTEMRNKRDVWTIDTKPFPEAHFAVMPESLAEPCIKAGCPPGGIVLDPFTGAGTTALVARRLGCKFVGVELNPDYIKIAAKRLSQSALDF